MVRALQQNPNYTKYENAWTFLTTGKLQAKLS